MGPAAAMAAALVVVGVCVRVGLGHLWQLCGEWCLRAHVPLAVVCRAKNWGRREWGDPERWRAAAWIPGPRSQLPWHQSSSSCS